MGIFRFFKKTKSNNENQVSTYSAIRYTATGVFGYEFVDENDVIVCTNSSVLVPNAPIRLDGFGYNLISTLNADHINICRTVEDSEGRTIACIQCIDHNRYILTFYNTEIEIVMDETSYNFYVDNSLIVSTFRNEQPYNGNDEYYDKEKMFDITVWAELEPVVLLVVFSIPSLVY